MVSDSILILDFGSQYNQLIARKIRAMGVYAEIVPYHISTEEIKSYKPTGLIFSGGPSSVNVLGAYTVDKEIFSLGIPILGICYGMQLIAHLLGGSVVKGKKAEYGKAIFNRSEGTRLLGNIATESVVWMSHFDEVIKVPEGFMPVGYSDTCLAAFECSQRNIYAVQFHPEVSHTAFGEEILRNFAFDICKSDNNWKLKDHISSTIDQIKRKVGDEKVILGLSGGVDSSVAAMLIHRAIGNQLTCIFIDTGLLRKDEGDKVCEIYRDYHHLNVKRINAQEEFLTGLKGVSDPEEKRKVIGGLFVDVFNREATKLEGVTFLAQGTIYPDVIESKSSHGGPSVTIKSHHNVGGLPEEMHLQLLEPLRELFKDEVREVGLQLGLPREMVMRHPFPGPGLGIRILGEIDEPKIEILQEADAIFIEELYKHDLYHKVSQAFVVLLPVKSVGVMGDERTYEYTVAVRSADTIDFMTATWSRLPYEILDVVSNRIINEVKGVNRVVYDISSKPPATIEWE